MSKPAARKHDARIEALEERIGHAFADRTLIREALTHGSALDAKAKQRRDYNRLEFLGDRVLGLVTAERLFEEHQDEEEGELAPRLNALVNRGACARAARRADLGAALVMSPSEESQGGRDKEAILADACESVIAALYIEGGLDLARGFITRFWGDEFEGVRGLKQDAKTMLQEWVAAKKKNLSYAVIDQSGPDHAPHFVVEVRIGTFDPIRGEGGSKREAQRAAATAFLKARGVDV